MMRESAPPIPQPDRVRFDRDDYAMPVRLGLCAECLSAGLSASHPIRIGEPDHRGQSMARDVQGDQITTAYGRSLLWQAGQYVPPDPAFLADLVQLFGDAASWTEGNGVPLPMVAVTSVGGTLLCAVHGAYERARERARERAAGDTRAAKVR